MWFEKYRVQDGGVEGGGATNSHKSNKLRCSMDEGWRSDWRPRGNVGHAEGSKWKGDEGRYSRREYATGGVASVSASMRHVTPMKGSFAYKCSDGGL
jgi:hypothetical protein